MSARSSTKHFLWLMIAWWTGGAWVLYFADAPTLVKDLATLQAPFIAYLWIGILTATTYVFAGHAREQVCIYMCPWPRIQAALTDEWALNVTYRRDRGEPRMLGQEGRAAARSPASPPATASTAISASMSARPASISATASSSAASSAGCASTPATPSCSRSTGPTGLIAYDTDINCRAPARRQAADLSPDPRAHVLYAAIIALVGSIMLYTLATRSYDGHQRAARAQPAVRHALATAASATIIPCASSTRPAWRDLSRWKFQAFPPPSSRPGSNAAPTATWSLKSDRTRPARSGCRCRCRRRSFQGSHRYRVQGCRYRIGPDRLGARSLRSGGR